MWSLGVPQGEAEFHDVYGLDAEVLATVPQPVLAVIFCFPDPPEVNDRTRCSIDFTIPSDVADLSVQPLCSP
jgi:hypothetical protein